MLLPRGTQAAPREVIPRIPLYFRPPQIALDNEGGTPRAGGLHAGGLHAGGLHAGGLHAGGLHAGGLHAGGLHAGTSR
jgi:hypothetical protein